MKWTKEDRKSLLAYKELMDSDDIRFKEIIKQQLLNNKYIIHVLNNKDLEDEEAEADEYFGVNILPYYLIKPTQTNVQNFICFETKFDEESRYNKVIKYGQIVFTILCEQKNIIDAETGIARQDLLAALLLDQFNWTNYFGNQIHCISDVATVVDNIYACRTLVFEGEFPNSISKTSDRLVGKDATRVINYQNVH